MQHAGGGRARRQRQRIDQVPRYAAIRRGGIGVGQLALVDAHRIVARRPAGCHRFGVVGRRVARDEGDAIRIEMGREQIRERGRIALSVVRAQTEDDQLVQPAIANFGILPRERDVQRHTFAKRRLEIDRPFRRGVDRGAVVRQAVGVGQVGRDDQAVFRHADHLVEDALAVQIPVHAPVIGQQARPGRPRVADGHLGEQLFDIAQQIPGRGRPLWTQRARHPRRPAWAQHIDQGRPGRVPFRLVVGRGPGAQPERLAERDLFGSQRDVVAVDVDLVGIDANPQAIALGTETGLDAVR